jgi:NAD(P)-dependent dehydrogenase (short-subunit alcohol dehydrogenase family)
MTLSLLDACVSIPSLSGTAGQGRSARPERTKVLLWRDLAQPDEITVPISWLSSAEASNVNGAVITADGRWTA